MTEPLEHRWSVDGIEEDVARVEEDGQRMLHVPRHLLPAGVAEGQLLRVTRASAEPDAIVITVVIDRAAATEVLAKSAATMAHAMAESRKRDPGGDVAL